MPTPPNSLHVRSGGRQGLHGQSNSAPSLITSRQSRDHPPVRSLPCPRRHPSRPGNRQGPGRLAQRQSWPSSPTPSPLPIRSTSSTPASPSSTTTPLNINSATAAAFSPDGLEGLHPRQWRQHFVCLFHPAGSCNHRFLCPRPPTSIAFQLHRIVRLALPAEASARQPRHLQHLRQFPGYHPASASTGATAQSAHLPEDGARRQCPHGQRNAFQSCFREPKASTFFFGVDNTGIDIIATTSSTPVTPPPHSVRSSSHPRHKPPPEHDLFPPSTSISTRALSTPSTSSSRPTPPRPTSLPATRESWSTTSTPNPSPQFQLSEQRDSRRRGHDRRWHADLRGRLRRLAARAQYRSSPRRRCRSPSRLSPTLPTISASPNPTAR